MDDAILALVEDSGLDPVRYQYFHQLNDNRTIVFNTSVDESIVENVILPLKDFEKDDSDEPVTLILSTPGGSVADGLVLCNVIDGYRKKLNIIVYGYAYSMGFAILCSGSKNPNVSKKCYDFTTALWHPGEAHLSGSTNDINDIQDFNRKIDALIKSYILDNTYISKEIYERNERSQFYFTSSELLAYGIVDEIIGEAKVLEQCRNCVLKKNCPNYLDYAYENAKENIENFSCEDFEPDA